MIRAYLIDLSTGKVITTEPITHSDEKGRMLLVTDEPSAHGHFKSDTYNNETATLVSPEASGSLLVTDMIVSSRKKVGGIVTVQFTDGVNTVPIVDLAADDPIQIAHTFKGRVRGWKDAFVQVIISDAFNTTVYIGYLQLPPEVTLGFAAWDAER